MQHEIVPSSIIPLSFNTTTTRKHSFIHSIMYSNDDFLNGRNSTVFPGDFPGERDPSDFTFQSDAFSSDQYGLNLMGSKMEDYLKEEGEFLPSGEEGFHSSSENMHSAPPPRTYGKSDDGYNWRKYGQKQVKGRDNPRSYYKCAFPTCAVKKKVEMDGDGHITEIVYKGTHGHPKPQSTRRSSSSSSAYNMQQISSQSNPLAVGAAANDNSWASFVEDDLLPLGCSSKNDNFEMDSKRLKGENESASGGRTVCEPRVVVQTTSEIDILDDGFRWRKYGQKVVKGNPNPRSYYKCTSNGCPVRKHVERAFQDPRAVITTYEGKHNHDIPPARGSASNIYGGSTNTSAAAQLQVFQDPASSINLPMW